LPVFKQNNVLIDIDSMYQLAWKFWSFTVERVVEGQLKRAFPTAMQSTDEREEMESL